MCSKRCDQHCTYPEGKRGGKHKPREHELNIFSSHKYYGTLYAYTPEVLPSAHRATGNGTAVALNRLMGIVAVIIATFANTATSVPIYLCASLFGVLAVVAVALPFNTTYK